ncbi:MAG TPA: hypothetical protein VG735_06755 [Caulobacterales bacterium]|nr:hypothetical protein [Caulobacterales bacterium]
MPKTFLDWVAWAGLVAPLCALAWAAVTHVRTESQRQRRADAERLQLLASILHNGSKSGLTAQLLAIDELAEFKRFAHAILRVARANRSHFASLGDKEVVGALDESISKLGG